MLIHFICSGSMVSYFAPITSVGTEISLEILTPTDLKFGPLAGTKMMCQNMELSNQFNANLARVRSYKIEVLQLFMYDEDGTELLVFKKVD